MRISKTTDWNIIHLTQTVTMLLLFSCYGQSQHQALNSVFNQNILEGTTNLELYETQFASRSPLTCAALCQDRQSSSVECKAFTYHPLDRTCEFYKTGVSSNVNSGRIVYQIQNKDVWHRVSVNGRIYTIYMSSDAVPHSQARTDCIKLGGHILDVETADEDEAVRALLVGYTAEYAWVGANDLEVEGQFVTDTDKLPLNMTVWEWKDGEPNNQGGVEHCCILDMEKLKLWDVPCHLNRPFLCEKDA